MFKRSLIQNKRELLVFGKVFGYSWELESTQSNGNCCSNLSFVTLINVYSLIHFTFTLSLYLFVLVPTMPQFDAGLGGIVSNRQRVGS